MVMKPSQSLSLILRGTRYVTGSSQRIHGGLEQHGRRC